jgi:hypothetical protein
MTLDSRAIGCRASRSAAETFIIEYMPRLAKQFLYGLLYLVIFVGVPMGIHFALLKPAPTCFDGVQNGVEEGVDCGGGCVRACIPEDLRPLEAVAGVKLVPVGEGRVSALVQVVNPNADYAAWQFGYTLTFEDSAGAMFTLSGMSYIYGGEVRDLVLPNIDMRGASFTGASVALRNPRWVPASAWPRPRLRVQNVTTMRADGQLRASGELVNDDVIAFPSVEIAAVFKGKFGEVAGMSRTELADVLPGVARPFAVVHPDIPDAEMSATSIALAAPRP